MSSFSMQVNRRRLWFLLVPCAGIAAYLNSFGGVFLLDDYATAAGAGLGESHLWPLRWLVDLTFAANRMLSAFPAGYHAVNTAIHLAAGLLLFGILRRTLLRLPSFAGEAEPLAAVCAAAWTVHPLQTESVTYICQRYESCAGMFALLSIWSFVRSCEASSPRSGSAWRGVAIAACVGGISSKENMAVIPLLVFFHDAMFISGGWKNAWRARRGFYTALAGLGWGVLAVLAGCRVWLNVQKGVKTVADISPLDYALSQPGVILHYLRLAFWPHPLCFDYAWPPAYGAAAIIVPGAAVAVLLAATVWGMARLKPVSYFGSWCFTALAPVSSVVPVGDLAFEHRMYLALAAPVTAALLLGWLCLKRLFAGRPGASLIRRGVAVALSAALIAALVALTHERNADYLSAVRMWRDVTAKQPMNVRAWVWLCDALLREGKVFQAEQAAVRAIQICRIGSSRSRGWSLNPRMSSFYESLAWDMLGRSCLAQQRLDEAERSFEKALSVRPDNRNARLNRAYVLALKGKSDEALRECGNVGPNIPPDSVARLRLLKGALFLKTGKWAAAATELKECSRCGGFEGLNAGILLAWLMATCPDDRTRNGQESLALLRRLAARAGTESSRVLEATAAALAEVGDFAGAADAQARAILARRQNALAGNAEQSGTGRTISLFCWDDSDSSMEKRLDLYRRGLPYREPE